MLCHADVNICTQTRQQVFPPDFADIFATSTTQEGIKYSIRMNKLWLKKQGKYRERGADFVFFFFIEEKCKLIRISGVESVPLNCGAAIDVCMFSGIHSFERRMRAKIIGCTQKLSHLSSEKVQYKWIETVFSFLFHIAKSFENEPSECLIYV